MQPSSNPLNKEQYDEIQRKISTIFEVLLESRLSPFSDDDYSSFINDLVVDVGSKELAETLFSEQIKSLMKKHNAHIEHYSKKRSILKLKERLNIAERNVLQEISFGFNSDLLVSKQILEFVHLVNAFCEVGMQALDDSSDEELFMNDLILFEEIFSQLTSKVKDYSGKDFETKQLQDDLFYKFKTYIWEYKMFRKHFMRLLSSVVPAEKMSRLEQTDTQLE